MAHENPTDDQLRRILTDAATIAMVGASANPEKASHGIMRKLQSVGYRVIPVNPRESEVLGVPISTSPPRSGLCREIYWSKFLPSRTFWR